MKKYLNIRTIFLIISILIIIAGTINLCFVGFEKSIEYKYGKKIEVYIPNGYEQEEVMNIAKECFDTDEILFLEVEKLNQVAGIKITEYSEEQFKNYISKIAEKYEMNEDEVDYYEGIVPETKISTIINPYILPIILITLLSLIFVIIKNFRANNRIRISLKVLKILVITLGLYFSLISLFRLQFSIYTMPLALAIYIVTLLVAVNSKCE